MAKVKVDVSELKEWTAKLKRLTENEYREFQLKAVRMLATEFILRAKERTPKGEYPAMIEFTTRDGKLVSFKNPLAGTPGGHLKDSWKIGDITQVEGGFEIEIYNDAGSENGESYASHVELGHRITNKKGGEVKGFQRGVFMMTDTEVEMATECLDLVEKEFELFLERLGI